MGLNCVYIFGALFWIGWHDLECEIWYVAVVVCVKQCQSLHVSLKQARLA